MYAISMDHSSLHSCIWKLKHELGQSDMDNPYRFRIIVWIEFNFLF